MFLCEFFIHSPSQTLQYFRGGGRTRFFGCPSAFPLSFTLLLTVAVCNGLVSDDCTGHSSVS